MSSSQRTSRKRARSNGWADDAQACNAEPNRGLVAHPLSMAVPSVTSSSSLRCADAQECIRASIPVIRDAASYADLSEEETDDEPDEPDEDTKSDLSLTPKRKKQRTKGATPRAQQATAQAAAQTGSISKSESKHDKKMKRHLAKGLAPELFPFFLARDRAADAIRELRTQGFISKVPCNRPVVVADMPDLGYWIQLAGLSGHPSAPHGPFYPDFLPNHPAAMADFSRTPGEASNVSSSQPLRTQRYIPRPSLSLPASSQSASTFVPTPPPRDDATGINWTGSAPPLEKRGVLKELFTVDSALLWPNRAAIITCGGYRLPPYPIDAAHKTVFYKDCSLGGRDFTLYPQLHDPAATFLAFTPVPVDFDDFLGPLFEPPSGDDFVRKGHLHAICEGTLGSLKTEANRILKHYQLTRDLMALALRRDEWHVSRDHPLVQVTKRAVPPIQDAWRIRLSLDMLGNGVVSRPVAKLWWGAFQRNARIVVGYINGCAKLTPNWEIRKRIEPLALMTDYPIRGVIFKGMSERKLYQVFVDHLWPVYAIVWLDAFVFDTNDKCVAQTGGVMTSGENLTNPNIDLEMCRAVDVHGYKLGNIARPPPPGVAWGIFERTGRGVLPRPSKEDNERIDADIAARRASALANVPGVTMNINGVEVKNQHPVFQQLATLPKAPDWAPASASASKLAMDRALNYVALLDNKNMSAPTLTPTVQAFYAEAKDTPFGIISMVSLWTHIILRARQAHGASLERPLSSCTNAHWRSVIGVAHWKKMRGPQGKGTEFDMDGEFLKHGSNILFAPDLSAALVREFAKPADKRKFEVAFGRLACPCPSTVQVVQGDVDLLRELAFALNLLRLLWFLSLLAQESLKAVGVPFAHHKFASLYLPDFTLPVPTGGEPRVVELIRRLVLNGGCIPRSGWPSLWSAIEHPQLAVRAAWVKDLREFVCMFADGASVFETGGTFNSSLPNWSETAHTGQLDISSELQEPFDAAQVAAHEQEMIDRLYVLAFEAGVMPVEFLKAPETLGAFKCRWCRLRCE